MIDDTNYRRTMSVQQFRKALIDSQVSLDLLGLDACTMQMIEVAYEMNDVAIDVIIGSKNTGTTWPFAEILDAVIVTPQISAEDFGKIIVDKYNVYHEGKTGITLSELKLGNISMVVDAVDELAAGILNESPFSEIQEQAACVMEQIQRTVLYVKNSPDWERARGISVYFPPVGGIGATIPPELQYFYKRDVVSFSEDASWHDLIASLLGTQEPSSTAIKMMKIRSSMATFDDDKIDLYDFCKRIVEYDS